jgi:nucleoside phosphorylase
VFARFAEATSVHGEEAVAKFIGFLRDRGPDDRFDAGLAADIVELEPKLVERLMSAAEEFELVQPEGLLQCPACRRVRMKREAEAELAEEEVVQCPECGIRTEDLRDWEEKVLHRLTASALAQATPMNPTLTVVVLTALEVEFEAVTAHLEDLEVEREGGTIFTVGSFRGEHVNWRVAAVVSEAGAVNAAATAQRALARFTPHLALFVGIAGGLEEQGMAWGKVVAATEISNYEWGADYQEFKLRPMGWRSAYSLRQEARHVKMANKWPERAKIPPLEGMELEAVVEPIAAGDKLVREKNSDTYQRVREQLERVVAVEMEGHGFLAALEQNQEVLGIVVRGISDLCYDKAEAEAAGTQLIAAANAAAFAFEILASYDPS